MVLPNLLLSTEAFVMLIEYTDVLLPNVPVESVPKLLDSLCLGVILILPLLD